MANAKKKSNAVVKLDTEFTGLQQMTSDKVMYAIQSNLEKESITPFDLVKLSVPPGGITSWQFPDDEAESGFKSIDVIDGVLLDYKAVKAYWEHSFDEGGGGTPPDCSSNDNIHGIGTVGGDPPGSLCDHCALNQFGSAGEGRKGKACKEMRLLFLLPKKAVTPLVIGLPPTSLKGFRQYLMRLSSGEKPCAYNEVVTKFKLRREDKPMPHGIVVPSRGANLSDAELIAIERYRSAFASMWESVTIDDMTDSEG